MRNFPDDDMQIVIIINLFKYMAFLQMWESVRGDYKRLQQELQQTSATETVGNYDFDGNFDLDNPEEDISNMRRTPLWAEMLCFGAPSRGTIQVRNTLQDSCLTTAMEVCHLAYHVQDIVATALEVFHSQLPIGSPPEMSEAQQEYLEQQIQAILYSRCRSKGLDPNRQAGTHFPHRPQAQQPSQKSNQSSRDDQNGCDHDQDYRRYREADLTHHNRSDDGYNQRECDRWEDHYSNRRDKEYDQSSGYNKDTRGHSHPA